LAQQGFAAVVATESGRMLNELADVGGDWVPFPANAKAPHKILANAFRLRNIVRRQNIKLIHARSRAPAWSARLAARMTDTPFVTTYHGIYNAKNAFKRYYNSVMARGDAVIANSEWTAAHVAREYRFKPKRLVVIPRGVDFKRFDAAIVSAERIGALRNRWGITGDETVILLPGRLTRWKGQAVLIDALARLKNAGALGNTRAVLVGDSQGRSGYEAELTGRIAANGLEGIATLAGHVNDMPAAYLAADIVVSASTDPEAFGRVAAEAGAMERPVIATDHGGAREIVIPDRSGLMVEPGDPASLAAALRTLIDGGNAKRRAMGAAARAHIAERFTVERMCADTLALYRDLLAERH
jgi:glycosyltransferase involved in cell wall biosynthesis